MAQDTWTSEEKSKLFGQLGRIEQRGETHTAQIDTLFRKVDELATRGCAVGSSNVDRIKRIEDAPKRANIGAASAAGGGIAAVILGIMEVIKRFTP